MNPYSIEKGAVVASTGGTCPIECAFCYTYSPEFVGFPAQGPQKVFEGLEAIANRFDLVQLGCDTEIFTHQPMAVELVRQLSKLRRDISFATRMALSERTIDELASIGKEMAEGLRYWIRGTQRNLVAFISMSGLEAAAVLEPKAPSPERRIETIRRLYEAGIPTFVYVKPLIPLVSDDELERLFRRTEGHCSGWVVGKMYFDEAIGQRMNVPLSSVGHEKIRGSPDRREWEVCVDERIARLTNNHNVFASSTAAVNSVRRTHYQDSIVEGPAQPYISMLERSFYPLRVAIPAETRCVHVIVEKSDIVMELAARRNIFTGETYHVPDVRDLERIMPYINNAVYLQQQPRYSMEPWTLLASDGRLFAHTGFLLPKSWSSPLDPGEIAAESLVKKLGAAARDRPSFIKLCEETNGMGTAVLPLERFLAAFDNGKDREG